MSVVILWVSQEIKSTGFSPFMAGIFNLIDSGYFIHKGKGDQTKWQFCLKKYYLMFISVLYTELKIFNLFVIYWSEQRWASECVRG